MKGKKESRKGIYFGHKTELRGMDVTEVNYWRDWISVALDNETQKELIRQAYKDAKREKNARIRQRNLRKQMQRSEPEVSQDFSGAATGQICSRPDIGSKNRPETKKNGNSGTPGRKRTQ